MANHEYRFIFENRDSKVPVFGARNDMPNAAGDSDSSAWLAGEGAEAFGKKVVSTVAQRTVISPLNQMTGGMATPVYQLGRSVVKGASAGGVWGAIAAVAIAGITLAIKKAQEQINKLEQEVMDLGNRDNALLRGGYVSQATHYSRQGFKITTTGRG